MIFICLLLSTTCGTSIFLCDLKSPAQTSTNSMSTSASPLFDRMVKLHAILQQTWKKQKRICQWRPSNDPTLLYRQSSEIQFPFGRIIFHAMAPSFKGIFSWAISSKSSMLLWELMENSPSSVPASELHWMQSSPSLSAVVEMHKGTTPFSVKNRFRARCCQREELCLKSSLAAGLQVQKHISFELPGGTGLVPSSSAGSSTAVRANARQTTKGHCGPHLFTMPHEQKLPSAVRSGW